MIKRFLRNIFYPFTILVIGLLIYMSGRYQRFTIMFHGITDEKEVIINSEIAAEVKKIHVTPGQLVKANQSILELNIPELEMRLAEVTGTIKHLEAKIIYEENSKGGELAKLQAEKKIKLFDIESQITLISARLKINKTISSALSGDTSNKKYVPEELQSLLSQKQLVEIWYRDRIHFLNHQIDSIQLPLKVELKHANIELQTLTTQKEKLNINASFSGIIGSIFFRQGEKVSPFTPVITMYPEKPAFIRGYIHEQDHDKINIGDKIQIYSLHDSDYRLLGTVTGIGSRIIEFPERLKKRPDIPVWGREVIVKMDEENKFLLGETVLLQVEVENKNLIPFLGTSKNREQLP